MIDALNTNGNPSVEYNGSIGLPRAASMSEGVVEAYGRGRHRKWPWSARVRRNGRSVPYRRQGFDTREAHRGRL